MALNGQLGYGFTRQAFDEGMRRGPDVIGVDGGSVDGGPYYLGAGKPMVSRLAVHRDLSMALPEAVRRGIPFIIGSAGTGGARPHVEWTLEIVRSIAREHDLSFRLAVIWADVGRHVVQRALADGRVEVMHPSVPLLTSEAIDGATHLVGQMGTEPFLRALELGADVVVAGRACDTAIFASPAIRAGYDPALAFHMAKIAECGTHCAVPGIGADCLWVELSDEAFTVEPLSPDKYCTPTSTAAHTLYEQANPYLMHEPEGSLDVSGSSFEAIDERKVRISGSRFEPADHYTVKIEGASRAGFRTMTLAGARDPIFIAQLPEIEHKVVSLVRSNLAGRVPDDAWSVRFRRYGLDGVMASREPLLDAVPHEIGLVIEVLAKTQEVANTACALVRSTMLHTGYAGRKTTAGNLALPYSPADIELGPVFEFSMYHLLRGVTSEGLFPVEIHDIRGVRG